MFDPQQDPVWKEEEVSITTRDEASILSQI